MESGPVEVGSWALEVGMWTPGGGNLGIWRLESELREVGSKPVEVAIWTLEVGI